MQKEREAVSKNMGSMEARGRGRVGGEIKENIYGKIFIPIQYIDSRDTEYSAKVIPISHT